ncbi:hypothetical protein D9M73_79900 [compost metagenome]
MMVCLDRHKHRYTQTHFVAVQQAHLLADEAFFGQALDAIPAGCRRQVDAFGNLIDRQLGIVLQNRKNSAVFFIHDDFLSILKDKEGIFFCFSSEILPEKKKSTLQALLNFPEQYAGFAVLDINLAPRYVPSPWHTGTREHMQ